MDNPFLPPSLPSPSYALYPGSQVLCVCSEGRTHSLFTLSHAGLAWEETEREEQEKAKSEPINNLAKKITFDRRQKNITVHIKCPRKQTKN